jgi:hypothetical protein
MTGPGKLRLLAQTIEPIAAKVSEYATTSTSEFVAETYAGLRSGKTYPDDVMAEYRRLTNQ